ncbi:ABC transporter permease [Actinoplanes sp. NPDC049548]|uniref:ABC transporter permease n=1 Tax=Actinoplanes sp. NPDC049548 TaxID=3155152 RepID=UPI003430FB78
MSAISVGLMSVIAWAVVRNWDDLEPRDRAALAGQPLDLILARPVSIAQIVVAVLGVMVMSAEYTTGMIRSTLQAQPRRLTVLTAKALVFGVFMLTVGETLSFLACLVGRPVIDQHIPVRLDDPGVLRALVGAGLYLAVLGLFSLAAGAVVRHTAGAITAVLGLMLVLSELTALLPGSWGRRVDAWMPTNAGQLILAASPGTDAVLGPWQGMAVFAGWTALLLGVAAVLFTRRDA